MSARVADLIAEAIIYVNIQSSAAQISRIERLRGLAARLAAKPLTRVPLRDRS